MATIRTPDARAAALAAAQDGLLTTADAERCGLTPDQRKGRTGSGRWQLVVPGVYRMPGSPDTWRQRVRAAQLAVRGAGGVASHVSAAALHALLPGSPLPHVTVPPGASARCRIAKVHRSPLPAADVCTVAGIRTTTVARTVVDLASVLDRPALERLVDDALCAGATSVDAVVDALARAGGHRPGRVQLRSVLAVWHDAIEPGSPAEVRLLRRLAEQGIEAPVTQFEIRLPDGTFVARVDAAWPDRMVAVEYEGLRHHAARRFEADEARYARLRALGWRLTTADKTDLLPGATRLVELLRRWLDAAA